MILEEETYERFGYYPSELPPKSHKPILTKCDCCWKERIRQKAFYYPLCYSCAKKGERNPWYGKQLSEEHKRKISEAHKGKILSEETKKKISEAVSGEKHPLYGQKGDEAPFYGKTHTEETKKKMSESHKGDKHPLFGKKLSEEYKKKISVTLKENPPFLGRHHTDESKEKLREARKHQIFPTIDTKPELIFIDFYNKFDIANRVKDTRDNSFHIGRLNPDFIIPDMKIAIFINGDYWHSPLLNYKIKPNRTASYQKKVCKKHRWKAIILWGTDLLREDAEAFVLAVFREQGIL